jgi:hypothetical protein
MRANAHYKKLRWTSAAAPAHLKVSQIFTTDLPTSQIRYYTCLRYLFYTKISCKVLRPTFFTCARARSLARTTPTNKPHARTDLEARHLNLGTGFGKEEEEAASVQVGPN